MNAFDNPSQLSSGLYLVYTGEFEEDPSSDTLLEFAQKHNENVEQLNLVVEKVRESSNSLNSVRSRGLLNGFIYGGSF